MGKDLSHLTSEEIETLMRRYYDGEAVSKLIKEYNISVHASELYKLFPPEVYQNYSCEYCDEFLVINRPSKTTKTSLDKGTQRKTTENELPSLTQCTA